VDQRLPISTRPADSKKELKDGSDSNFPLEEGGLHLAQLRSWGNEIREVLPLVSPVLYILSSGRTRFKGGLSYFARWRS